MAVVVVVKANSLNVQEGRLATLPLLATRLNLSHAIVVRFHVSKINVVILKPETAISIGVFAVAQLYRKDFPPRVKSSMSPGLRHRGAHYHVDVIYLHA